MANLYFTVSGAFGCKITAIQPCRSFLSGQGSLLPKNQGADTRNIWKQYGPRGNCIKIRASNSIPNHPLAVRIRRSIQHGLLALLLLLSQQMGIAHAVSHLSDANQKASQNKQLPIEQTCEQCLAYAQIGSALTSPAALPLVQAASSVAIDIVLPQHVSARTVFAFQSRAPPQ